jgi:hypothetical protein
MRQRVDQRQLRLRFAIETKMPAGERGVDSGAVLPTPEKTIFLGIAAGLEHAVEFASGNDVETRAGLRRAAAGSPDCRWL